ncbi:hypothetical protein M436DRAFT_36685 [Aureobasidium namibiae CBS 147.97]|uniref:YMC020W-like alpha/beta hydrolase domain-containing protein n=1 Tax=Aureobasidium namibiae CBS 147.97 TaxID=1043004 RepID=A0A074X3A4_9PEZI|nr:uncharacterized protein M436DRAFT_36685 [Aureobasidium namibiae CBS 147.97]KEQ78224.1 hypothetical protein M436DRAFT_36685 [Aureobasidium namibiae CBS 147.97]
MGPRRKKNKPSTPLDDPDSTQSDNTLPHKIPPLSTAQGHSQPQSDTTQAVSHAKQSSVSFISPSTPSSTAEKRSSWYKGAPWRSKANPVAQATHESISVAGGATNESLAGSPQSGGRFVHPSLRRSSKSIPTISSDSVNATGNSVKSETQPEKKADEVVVKTDNTQATVTASSSSSSTDLKPLPTDAITQQTPQAAPEAPLPPEPTQDAASGWFGGWWSRPDGYTDHSRMLKVQDDRKEASSTPLPSTPEQTPAQESSLDVDPININDTMRSVRSVGTAASSRSWFGLWSNAQNQQQTEQETVTTPSKDASPDRPAPVEEPVKPTETPNKKPAAPEVKQGEETPQTKSSGWAFWSRAEGNDESATPNGTQRQVGELAVADTPSQSHPEAAQFNEQRKRKTKSTKLGLAAMNNSSSTSLSSASQPQVALKDAVKTPDTTKSLADAKAAKPQAHPNLVIPSFDESYSAEYIPSYRERLTTYVASTLRLIETPSAPKHVSITPTPPKIKNAIAIGVHGYFPAPLIQKVLGQPTGTSIRFANYASTAIRDWVQTNQPDTPCEIETVALEGEGFIADRVATLWKLMLNWLSHLRQADLILVACHSQGVPVAIMLVHKLLQLGCLSPHAKIGICAMAGVNLGPFADYKSRWLGAGAAAELFEFSRQDSRVSTEYKAALDGVLRHGVRITYCGSIDDQLVSLESSTFSTLTHPYVYRAVFVDGRLHAPDFLSHLVAFALKLRNLGVSDHGLIRELSLPLAGSLYGGEGHSRIYDDPAVYTLALRFCLETTDLPSSSAPSLDAASRRSSRGGPPESVSAANSLRRGSVSASSVAGIPPSFADFEIPASGSNANPYFLPWALRGILEEDVVKGEDMKEEVRALVEEFEEWRPVSKVLKDVRFRLEGVRSKL